MVENLFVLLGALVIKMFRTFFTVLADYNLDPKNFKVTITCSSLKNQMRLEAAIKREFDSMSKDPHGSAAPRFNEGTIYQIPFELNCR